MTETSAPVAVSPSPRKPPSVGPLLVIENLKTYFPVRRGLLRKTVGYVRAVDDVSLHVNAGETLGLVGESGCGKSTVGRTLLKLIPATEGDVFFDGQSVFHADRTEMHALRRQMQIIFQDPVGSLNPRMTVGRIIGEPIAVHGLASGAALNQRVASLLKRVGLEPEYAQRYPHEFSGGQRQRIGIARALSLNPKFLVCDEPVSALDVSIQSQILNLLSELKRDLGLSYLFIAHNLAVIEHFCDRVAVMYLGRIVEIATRDAIYAEPRHPYTQALLSAAPMPDPAANRKRIVMTGEVPSPMNPPTGCAFHPRCYLTKELAKEAIGGPGGVGANSTTVELTVLGKKVRVMRKCVDQRPDLLPSPTDASHCGACHYADEAAKRGGPGQK